jgi:hypothetical protein
MPKTVAIAVGMSVLVAVSAWALAAPAPIDLSMRGGDHIPINNEKCQKQPDWCGVCISIHPPEDPPYSMRCSMSWPECKCEESWGLGCREWFSAHCGEWLIYDVEGCTGGFTVGGVCTKQVETCQGTGGDCKGLY